MDLHDAAPVAQIISSILSALDNVRDLAKGSSDHELKEKINEAYNMLFELRNRTFAMDEEIRELKAKLAKKESVTEPRPPFWYLYKTEDSAHEYPLCPECYATHGRISHLSALTPWNGGERRECRCGYENYEKPMSSGPVRIGRMSGRR